MPLPSIPLKFPSEFPPKINTTNIKSQIDKSISALKTQSENAQPPKDVRFEISDDFKNATDKVESPMQKVLSEITQKVVNSDNFYDEENPAPPAKDKKYYKDLEMYKEIKKKHGCVDKYGERLDTSDALKYA